MVRQRGGGFLTPGVRSTYRSRPTTPSTWSGRSRARGTREEEEEMGGGGLYVGRGGTHWAQIKQFNQHMYKVVHVTERYIT